MSKRSSTKSLDDYLENLLNGNIQNDKELISRGDLDSFFELTGDAKIHFRLFLEVRAQLIRIAIAEKSVENVCSCKT